MDSMFISSTSTSPLVGRSMPAMMFRRVVLPEPEGPMSARNSPLSISREQFSSATTCSLSRLNILLSFEIRTRDSAIRDSPVCLAVISPGPHHRSKRQMVQARRCGELIMFPLVIPEQSHHELVHDFINTVTYFLRYVRAPRRELGA